MIAVCNITSQQGLGREGDIGFILGASEPQRLNPILSRETMRLSYALGVVKNEQGIENDRLDPEKSMDGQVTVTRVQRCIQGSAVVAEGVWSALSR